MIPEDKKNETNKPCSLGWAWWLTSVIRAPPGAEIGKTAIQDQPS